MKNYFSTLTFMCLISFAFAQKSERVYLFKNNGEQVQTKAEADFVRIIEQSDSSLKRFQLQELYINGNKKTLGYITEFEPELKFEGWVIRFDSAGKREEIREYKDGKSIGKATSFWANGKVRRITEYPNIEHAKTLIETNISDVSEDLRVEKRIFEGDSTGKVFVENGNGHFREVIEVGDNQKVEEGDYVDGYKHGQWTGVYPNRNESFLETYDTGKMLGGETTLDGKKFVYEIIRKKPEFPGGMNAWYSYLSKTSKNPVYGNGVLIKGSAQTHFIIAEDGKISEVKVKESSNKSIDLEAARVLYKSPKWQPGKFRGIPGKFSFDQKFKF